MMSTPSALKIQPVKKRIRNFHEVNSGYSRRAAIEEARRCPQCHNPVCRQACPLGIDIPLFIRFLREGDFSAALNKIREANPFPEICGRVCSAPCETRCILHREGLPIEIRELERAAHERGHKKFVFGYPASRTGPLLAVIGSGPCGLAAAQRLAENNFRVTVFESLPFIGGLLRTGLPEFRLPVTILNRMTANLKRAGVRFENHMAIGKTMTLDALFQADFRAVLYAGGAGSIVIPDMPGIYLKRVYAAEELLWQANHYNHALLEREMRKKLGDHLLVIGNTPKALDVARLCIRLGKHVEVVFDDIEDNLKAHPHDKQQLVEEGVNLRDLTLPGEIVSDDYGSAVGLRCLTVDYGDPDGQGQWRLMPVPGSQHILHGDTIIFAQSEFSQEALTKIFPGVQVAADGTIRVKSETGMTDLAGVFAAGAAVHKGLSLVETIDSGQKVAQHIQAYCE